jgi:hypothetical protein
MLARHLSRRWLTTLLIPVLATGCDSTPPQPTSTASEAVVAKPLKELKVNPQFKGQRVELPGPRR